MNGGYPSVAASIEPTHAHTNLVDELPRLLGHRVVVLQLLHRLDQVRLRHPQALAARSGAVGYVWMGGGSSLVGCGVVRRMCACGLGVAWGGRISTTGVGGGFACMGRFCGLSMSSLHPQPPLRPAPPSSRPGPAQSMDRSTPTRLPTWGAIDPPTPRSNQSTHIPPHNKQ